jgi:hypothetical protein
MMNGNAQALAAAALSRQTSGMVGQYRPRDISPVLAAALYPRKVLIRRDGVTLGAMADDLQQVGLDAATTFISSGGDVDTLYEPIFKALQVLTLAIPPPGSVLVSAGVSAAKIGTDAIRGAIKETLRAAGQYTPIEVSRKVNNEIMGAGNTLSWWADAARDKFAQYVGSSLPAALAVAAYNGTVGEQNRLNTDVHSRLADRLYNLAMRLGAAPWQAGMAAYRVAVNTGADSATKLKYASMTGNPSNPEAGWRGEVANIDGDIVDKKDVADIAAGKKPPKGGKKAGDNTMLYVAGAAGLIGLALLATSGDKKSAPSAGATAATKAE